MTLIEATRSRIISLLKKKHFTQSELSTRACVSKTTINDFLNRKNSNITLITLFHLCEGLNIDLEEFFSDNIFDKVDDD